MKIALEELARNTKRSVGQVLEDIVAEYLDRSNSMDSKETEKQRRLHRKVAKFAGCISGGDPTRSRRVRELVREQLLKRYPHAR